MIRVVWSMDDTPAGIVHSARLLGVEIGRVVRGEDGRYRWRMAGEGSWGGYRRGLGTLGNAKQAVTKAWMELRTGDGRLPSRPDPDKAP